MKASTSSTSLPTRRSVAVVDSSNGAATLFNEPGPRVPAATWGDLEARLAATMREIIEPEIEKKSE